MDPPDREVVLNGRVVRDVSPMKSQGVFGRGEISLKSTHKLAKFIQKAPTDSPSSFKKTPQTRQEV